VTIATGWVRPSWAGPIIGALVIALGVLLALGWHEHNVRLEAEGAAKVFRTTADSAASVADTRYGLLKVARERKDTAVARQAIELAGARADAAREYQRNQDVAARARRAAAFAPDAAARVIAAAGDSAATVEAFAAYVAVRDEETAAQEERAEAAEHRGDLLERGLAIADSISASKGLELDAAYAVIEPLRTALAARTAESASWQRAAEPGNLFGLLHVDPSTALVVGGIVGAITTAAVLR
jgi:hypothetical protein